MFDDNPFGFILKLCIAITALSLVVGFFVVPFFKADDVLEYQLCEVVNVISTSSRYGTAYNTVVVRLEDGTLKKFDGCSAEILMIKAGDYVTVKISGKVGFSLSYKLVFDVDSNVN
jgi:hypothetical protein